MAREQPLRVPRTIDALPDLAAGIACLTAWIRPSVFGSDSEAVDMTAMTALLEFLMIHASAIFTAIAFLFKPKQSVLAIAGLSLCYMAIALALCLAFQEWWPLFVFAWLPAGKTLWILANPQPRRKEALRQGIAWLYSFLAYMAAFMIGMSLPLPHLGLSPEAMDGNGLQGSAAGSAAPHAIAASMAFYFFSLAIFKWAGSDSLLRLLSRIPLFGTADRERKAE